ncbi:phosphate acyltransferase [Pseudogemmobacter sp. W21_MBD1_M6]|uniref:phosphate acyltransferase n=1 Tax=Pseudogemmobacter sp. W21_MBD1_M6 TaxID=3240271 RepID=UPI003F94E5E3
MTVLDRAYDAARAAPRRVVFPEAQDERIIEAARRLTAQGLATPVRIPDVASAAHVAALMSVRGIKESLARRMLEKPLFRAAAMVAANEADAMVAGAANPTRRVIEAAGIVIGMAQGVAAPSSFFLMVFPDGRELVFADCAVNVAPDAAELAGIARASARSAQALLGAARVAMLSFSTLDSGAGPSVDLVRDAVALLDGLDVVGPVQADAALSAGIAVKKGVRGGDANVLIFPTLDAGNIGYKLCQQLAGAQAVGPMLQGFRRPVCDLSRGAAVDDIVAATVLTLAMG